MRGSAEGEAEKRGLWPLQLLNFFMADIQAGSGPFLGVYLQAHGWQTGLIGTMVTLGGIAGTLLTAPAGALIDATPRKRLYVVLSAIGTVAASALVLLSQSFPAVVGAQVATAVAGAAIVPAVTGITLGLVRQKGFNRQNGRNQAFNHAGNMVGAALSGFLGWRYGLPAVFGLAAIFALFSVISTFMIPRDAIDNRAARGMKSAENDDVDGLGILWSSKPLLVLAAALIFFHLGNGAMLPLYGLAVVDAKQGDPAALTAMTIVISQGTMIFASLAAMHLVEKNGYWTVLLVSFLPLPIRGLLAANLITWWGVYPVQILDGIGAGLQSVAVPGLIARILDGSDRINAGQGTVMMIQGLGASLSPAIGGWIAQILGYPAAFLILGLIGSVCVALWLWFRPSLQTSHKIEAPA